MKKTTKKNEVAAAIVYKPSVTPNPKYSNRGGNVVETIKFATHWTAAAIDTALSLFMKYS